MSLFLRFQKEGKMKGHFFAVINRMKYITRWGLMRNTESENLQQHSFQTAILAHALAVIENTLFDGHADADRAAVIALYHDASEIITGDMPTPVKYYNDEIQKAYQQIEVRANDLLLEKLPESLRPVYTQVLHAQSSPEWVFVKAADTLSAYIKCVEELKAGNEEFLNAKKTIEKKLQQYELKSLQLFLKEFLESYSLTLDDQTSL